jgi:F-type H+-transporting ATPase subunit delta
MRSQAVARRYAEALLSLAKEQGLVDKMEAESKLLGELFADRELRAFFGAPQIDSGRKKEVLNKALQGRVSPLVINLAKLLVDKGRILYLPEIMREFDAMTDELRGVEEVSIVSASPLNAQQVEAIKANVQHFSARPSLRVNTEVDPSLIGGVLVRLGSRVLDGSLATRLGDMRQSLGKYQGGTV